MVIPRPFSRAVLFVASPIHVPPDANDVQMAAYHGQMQSALERSREKAEQLTEQPD
jgi:lysophospholipid acyltransferase (LPLAT)-like uncharacterized protein